MRLPYIFKATLVAVTVAGLCYGAHAASKDSEAIEEAMAQLERSVKGLTEMVSVAANDLHSGLLNLCHDAVVAKAEYQKECAGIVDNKSLMKQAREQLPHISEYAFESASAYLSSMGQTVFDKCEAMRAVHELLQEQCDKISSL